MVKVTHAAPRPRSFHTDTRLNSPKTPCIYLIRVGEQVYFGATRHYVQRMSQHRRALKAGQHHNTHLQRAYDAAQTFQSEILTQAALEDLGALEQQFLEANPQAVIIERVSSLLPGVRKIRIKRGWARERVTPVSQPVLTPRVNQIMAETCLIESLQEGEDRGLFRSPCGTGKTKMAALFGRHFGKCLFITHFDELIGGTIESLQGTWPGHHIGVIKAQEHHIGEKWTVASLQTMARRLPEYDPQEWDLVCCDEAHLFGAESGVAVMGHLRPRYFAGFTATPERATGTPLSELFGRIVFNMTVPEAIAHRLIVPMKAVNVMFKLKRPKINKASGDFDPSSVARILGSQAMLDATAKVIHEQHEGRPTLVYAATRHHARKLAEALGPQALAVTGEDKDRDVRIKAFMDGNIQFLVSVQILSYGFDAPHASCVVLAIMTQSAVRFTQIVGRGMRTAPDKTDSKLIDLGGNLSRGMRIEKDWNFEVQELDPLEAAPGSSDVCMDKDVPWDNEAVEIEAIVTDAEVLKPPPEQQIFKITPSPASERQLSRLGSWGYQPHPDLTKKQANDLISAHPPTPRQLEALKKLGYDPRGHWTFMLAHKVLDDEYSAPQRRGNATQEPPLTSGKRLPTPQEQELLEGTIQMLVNMQAQPLPALQERFRRAPVAFDLNTTLVKMQREGLIFFFDGQVARGFNSPAINERLIRYEEQYHALIQQHGHTTEP